MFADCDLGGAADVLKVVSGAASDDDARRIHAVGETFSKAVDKPYIGLCLGVYMYV
jgi:3-dehydroquinate dehydratase